MYGSHYDSIQSNDQYSNPQYSNKDYLIKNTQQFTNKTISNLPYPVKQELTTLTPNSLNETYVQNLSTSINQIDSTDQWPINYNEFSSLLTPDSQQSIQNTIQQPIQSNVACNQSNLQTSNVQTNLIPTNIQQNIQSNVQFNIQLNVHPPIATNNNSLSIVQTNESIQPVVEQQVQQTTTVQNQFTNQSSNQLNNQLSNRPQITQFDDYTTKEEPFTKKIKCEKINFNSINYRQTNYFDNSSNSIRQTNQMQPDFQCNLSYTNQQINRNTGNTNCFNNSNQLVNNNEFVNNLSPSVNCYLSRNVNNDQTSISYQSINSKSDQQNYTTLTNMTNEQNKLDESLKEQQICLSNPTLHNQSSQSIVRSLNTTNSTNNSNYRIPDLPFTNSQSEHLNMSIFNSNSNPNLELSFNVSNQTSKSSNSSNFNPPINPSGRQAIKCKKSTEKCLINLIKNKKAVDNNQLLSSSTIKLVHNKEVPNLRNSNKTIQNRTNKSTIMCSDEEEKRRRRRERNKLAATKCRNKKKEHAIELNEQSVSLDTQNRALRTEMETLKMEEQRLAQILLNHKRICHLRFTMIANELEQIYEPNQFNQINFNTSTGDFNNHLFNQPLPINDSQYKMGRIKMKKTYDDPKLNQLTDPVDSNPQLYNQQVFNQPAIKIEEYNYQSDFNEQITNYQSSSSPSCFNNTNPPQYSQISSPQLTNYDQFNQNSTNYGSADQITTNKRNESNSSNLTNVNYLCTNSLNGNNDVFLC